MLALSRPSTTPRTAHQICGPRLVRKTPGLFLSVHPTRERGLKCAAFGKDVVDGWLDMTKLVAGSGSSNKSPYEELASAIGRDVYVDIQGWHLYLRDMTAAPNFKMSQALASQLGPQADKGLREADIEAVLKKVPVRLGAGKMRVALYDVMPSMCVSDLTKIVESYGRK